MVLSKIGENTGCDQLKVTGLTVFTMPIPDPDHRGRHDSQPYRYHGQQADEDNEGHSGFRIKDNLVAGVGT